MIRSSDLDIHSSVGFQAFRHPNLRRCSGLHGESGNLHAVILFASSIIFVLTSECSSGNEEFFMRTEACGRSIFRNQVVSTDSQTYEITRIRSRLRWLQGQGAWEYSPEIATRWLFGDFTGNASLYSFLDSLLSVCLASLRVFFFLLTRYRLCTS